MPLRGTSRVLRVPDGSCRHTAMLLGALTAVVSPALGGQLTTQQNEAAAIEWPQENGVVIHGNGHMSLSIGTEARKPLMRGETLARQLAESDQEITLEAARLEVAEAANAVQRQEALEEIMSAAQEVAHQREMEELAEEHLRKAAEVLDEVSHKRFTVAAELTDAKAETRSSSHSPACGTCQCKFIDRHGAKTECDTDYGLRLLAAKWLTANSTVLEVGAMYGTTSCAIATRQRNSGRLVAVEPDHRRWTPLEKNRQENQCNFTTVRGVLGQEDVKAIETKEGMKYDAFNGNSRDPATDVIIPHMSLGEIQSRYKLHFDTAVIDCNGCLPTLVKQNTELFPQLELLLVAGSNEAETTELKKLAAMGDFKEVEVVGHYHVLRRKCGSIVACAVPAHHDDPVTPSESGKHKVHIENM